MVIASAMTPMIAATTGSAVEITIDASSNGPV